MASGASKSGFRLHVSARNAPIVQCRGATRAIRARRGVSYHVQQLLPNVLGSFFTLLLLQGQTETVFIETGNGLDAN